MFEPFLFQDFYAAFGGQSNYEFAKRLMKRSDNVQRFVKRQEDDNERYTFSISK